ncbi:MAG: serine hydrolase domain-containing protein [Ekhidna sp.]
MRLFLPVLLLISLCACKKEDEPGIQETLLYFPPIGSSEWETIDPLSLGWDSESLEKLKDYLPKSNTKALIILKDGKIAFEEYDGKGFSKQTFTSESYWYWASAAKTLTSFLIGRVEAEGMLSLDDPSNTYLGAKWTNLTSEQENKITVRHQLSMITGLDDNVANIDCTDPECLIYLQDPEKRWAYHNAPYTLLDGVIENASGQSFDSFFNQQLRDKIGMEGFWDYSGFNHIFYSPARSMARFGLLILNKGNWNGEEILNNQVYYEDMITSSQDINPSYGYLWWLNGKNSFKLPGLQTNFSGMMSPDAPAKMFAAIGKNGQLINIVPSQNLVVIRMGDSADDGLVAIVLQNELWEKLNAVIN